MAFGRSFDTLEKGESHFYIDLMHGSAAVGGMLGTMPWSFQLFKLVPISWTPMGRMLMYSEQCVDERRVRDNAPLRYTALTSGRRNTSPRSQT